MNKLAKDFKEADNYIKSGECEGLCSCADSLIDLAIASNIRDENNITNAQIAEKLYKIAEIIDDNEYKAYLMAAASFIDSIGVKLAELIANDSRRNSVIINQYKNNREKYGQTIVFAQSVDMAIVLNKLFNDAGIKSGYVVSSIKDKVTGITRSNEDNERVINAYRNKELDVIINVNILTEGTDLPQTKTIFLTRPTKSTILMTQMIGRALRGVEAGGTKEAYIVSFIDDWQNKIAWVNPEELYIDENADFSKKDYETQKHIMRLISIKKIEEFAHIINDTVDERLSNLDLIERIPVGIYRFSYLIEDGYGDESNKNCNILVYDCMKEAYENLMEWLPSADLYDIDSAAEHINNTLFGEQAKLLGYDKNDVRDILNYYKQTEEIPEMISIEERDNYDISAIARQIVDNPVKRKEIIEQEWDENNNKWSAFLGIDNRRLFRKLIYEEIDKLEYPDEHKKEILLPITKKEEIQIQELPLYEIRKRYPALGEKLRDAVFNKYTDEEGYYFSASGNYRSKNKLDFQIDHIKPRDKGGLTTLDNLQLLTRAENMIKSNK